MRSIAVMLAGVVCGGCFPPDLGDGKVACGTGGACPPDYVCRADQRCWKTAATGGGDDMATSSGDMSTMTESCLAAGMRVCADAGHSAVCSAAAASPTLDRTCPPGSTCSGGRCQPPAGAKTCKKASDCTGSEVCAPFVVGAVVDTRCVAPLPGATGGSASSCNNPGFDPKCGTGYCTQANGNNVCAYACSNQNDCGGNNCSASNGTVEGVAATGKVCGN